MSTEQLLPIGFLSYAHFHDEFEDSRIARWTDRLEKEVRFQTGTDFKLFLDRDQEDIGWGQQWKARIDEGLDSATFLVAILTPLYFCSEYCHNEYMRFKKREEKLGRRDLILPVLYIPCDELSNPDRCKYPDWPKDIADRQYRSWVKLRFEQETSAKVRRAFADLAGEIKVALRNVEVKQISAFQASAVLSKDSRDKKGSVISEEEVEKDIQNILGDLIVRNDTEKHGKQPYSVWKREKKELIVDQSGGAGYATITEALNVANSGDRIIIRPGRYREYLEITKRVELVGSGDIDEIIIESEIFPTIECAATSIVLTNLTIINSCDVSRSYDQPIICVANKAGELIIGACKIRGGNFALHAGDTSRLCLLNCHVFGSSSHGVFIWNAQEVSIVGTWIENCGGDGIFLNNCLTATINHSKISDNLGYGIYCESGVVLEESENEFNFNVKGDVYKKGIIEPMPF